MSLLAKEWALLQKLIACYGVEYSELFITGDLSKGKPGESMINKLNIYYE